MSPLNLILLILCIAPFIFTIVFLFWLGFRWDYVPPKSKDIGQ